LYPGKILCSMLKKVEKAVFNSIRDIIYENFSDGHKELGLKENGVDISPMTFTQDIKSGDFTFKGVTQSRWDWIEDIKAKIIAGSIIVPEEPDWDRIQRSTYPTKETEIPDSSTTETFETSLETGVSIPSPGFELTFLIWTMALAVLWVRTIVVMSALSLVELTNHLHFYIKY
ncbi:MAG: hypothetical protein ACFFDI_29715, partial [Promethearchaeota archaeon]